MSLIKETKINKTFVEHILFQYYVTSESKSIHLVILYEIGHVG